MVLRLLAHNAEHWLSGQLKPSCATTTNTAHRRQTIIRGTVGLIAFTLKRSPVGACSVLRNVGECAVHVARNLSWASEVLHAIAADHARDHQDESGTGDNSLVAGILK